MSLQRVETWEHSALRLQITTHHPATHVHGLKRLVVMRKSYKPATARRQLYGRLLGILIAPLPHATSYDDVDLP